MPTPSTRALGLNRGAISWPTLQLWHQLLIFFAVYYGLSWVQQMLTPDSGIPPVALSIGVAVGVQARVQGRLSVVIAGSQVVLTSITTIQSGGSLTQALCWSIVVALVALAGGALIRGLAPLSLPRWDGLAAFIVVSVAVALIGAIVMAALSGIAGMTAVPALEVFQDVWVALTTGIVLAAPAVLMFRRSRIELTVGRFAELVTAIAVTVVLMWLVLNTLGGDAAQPGIQYFLIPAMLWFAIRFGMAITAAVSCIVDLTVLAATYNGMGPYSASEMQSSDLLTMQIALALVSLAVYAVAVNEEQRRASSLQLLAAHGLVDSLLANSDAMISIVQYDRTGQARYLLANPRFADTLGHSVETIVGRSQADLAPDVDAVERQRSEDWTVIETNRAHVFVTRSALPESRRGGASSRVFLVTKFPVATADEYSAAVGSIAIDITEHRRRERLMRLTFDESPVPMVRMAWRDGRATAVLDANRSAADLLKVSVDQLVGQSLDRFVHSDEQGHTLVPPGGVPDRPRQREARLVRGDGQDVWVAITATVVEPVESGPDEVLSHPDDETFALVVLEDITARRVAEQTLTHQALHDALTGVLNRYALIDRLDAALNRLWRDTSHIAVLFCDLDGFKNLNDTLGHRAGDQMLISVSERLRAVMRPQDTVARLGGDEFVLICEDLPSPAQAQVIGERIREAMRESFRIDEREYGITVSVGISTTTDPRSRAEDLLRRADLAMYRAKDKGRNRVEYYAEELEARAVAQVEATQSLRSAIAEDRIRVHYQPIVDVRTASIVGVEALARIEAADGSLVHPSTFISVAESSGLVTPMGERVLEIALNQLEEWVTSGIDVQLNVNVSPRQLSRATFAPAIFEHLVSRGLTPNALCLEITEGAVVDATGPTLITLRRLRAYGVSVGIDDFGTGYSSLTTLKHLPADVIKVDRSFVEGIGDGDDSNDRAIVGAVVKIAHDLGCQVVAEGVEDAVQVEALREMGCDQVQGYRYGRPVPAEQMTALLHQRVLQPVVDITDTRHALDPEY